MALEVEVQDHEGVRLLEVAGKLDSRSLRELEMTLLESLNEGHRSLLLDLSRLEVIDGAGLRVLVTIGERLEAEAGRLALCALHPDVKEVFDIARLSRSLVILPSRAEALGWLEESVRVARVARFAGSLIRKAASGPARRYTRGGPDKARLELASRLLGLG